MQDPHINPSSGVWDDNYYANTGKYQTGGSSSSGSPFDATAAYKSALNTVPQVDTSQLETLSGQVGQDAQNSADAIRGQTPNIQNIYTALGKEIDNTYGQQYGQLQTQAASDSGQQKAQAAASGFDTTNGYEAGLLRAVQASYDSQMKSLADDWGIKRDQLAGEESKDLQQLQIDASKALMDGDTQKAAILSQIAQIKQGHLTAVQTLASSVLNGNIAQQSQNLDQAKFNEQVKQDNKPSSSGSGGSSALDLLSLLGLNQTPTPTKTTSTPTTTKPATATNTNAINDVINNLSGSNLPVGSIFGNPNLPNSLQKSTSVPLNTNLAGSGSTTLYTSGLNSHPFNLGSGY